MAEFLAFKRKIAICNNFRTVRGTSEVNLANWNTSSIFTNLWSNPDSVVPNITLPAVYDNSGATKGVRGISFQTGAAKLREGSLTLDTLLDSQLNVLLDKFVGQTHGTGTYPDGTSVPSGTAIPYETDSEPPVVDLVYDDGNDWYVVGVVFDGFTTNFSHSSPVSITAPFKVFDGPVALTTLGSATKDNWAPEAAAGDGILGFKDVSSSLASASTLWSGSLAYTTTSNGRWDAGRGTTQDVSNILLGNDLSSTWTWTESAQNDSYGDGGTEIAADFTVGSFTFACDKVLINDITSPSELDQGVTTLSGTGRNTEGGSDTAVLVVSGLT